MHMHVEGLGIHVGPSKITWGSLIPFKEYLGNTQGILQHVHVLCPEVGLDMAHTMNNFVLCCVSPCSLPRRNTQ